MDHNRYGRAARPALKKLLREFCSLSPDEEIKLTEEIQIARIIAARSVKIFEACVLEDSNDGPTEDDQKSRISAEAKALSISTLQAALTHVASLVDKQAKVMALRNDTLSKSQLDFIMSRVVDKLTFYLDDKPKLLEEIIEDIMGITPPEKSGSNPRVTISIQ